MARSSVIDEFYPRRRVLITGGVGFIGSNLARALVALGAEVTVVDSLIPEYGGNLRNLHGIESQVRVNLADVRDQVSDWGDLVRVTRLDKPMPNG